MSRKDKEEQVDKFLVALTEAADRSQKIAEMLNAAARETAASMKALSEALKLLVENDSKKCREKSRRLSICRDCDIPHYDNCLACYGFGHYSAETEDGKVGVTAGAVIDGKIDCDTTEPCPLCKSTIKGLPEAIRCGGPQYPTTGE